MPDVIVLCEGHTEREFCRSVIAPVLAPKGVYLSGTLVGKTHRKQGGIRPWQVYKNELTLLSKQRPDWVLSVLVDYYAMPLCWPGRTEAKGLPLADRGRHIEDAVVDDLAGTISNQMVPCVQLHEFESLLFVDAEATALNIAVGAGYDDEALLTKKIQAIADEFKGKVEAINDSPNTAPSKRLIEICGSYDKVAWGPPSARDAGLDALREACPWLDRWMTALEMLGA